MTVDEIILLLRNKNLNLGYDQRHEIELMLRSMESELIATTKWANELAELNTGYRNDLAQLRVDEQDRDDLKMIRKSRYTPSLPKKPI